MLNLRTTYQVIELYDSNRSSCQVTGVNAVAGAHVKSYKHMSSHISTYHVIEYLLSYSSTLLVSNQVTQALVNSLV